MREAVQGAARAEIVGPSGWIKGPQNKTNKKFLVNTLRSTVSSNKYFNSKSRHYHSTNRYSSKKESYSEGPIRSNKYKRSY